MNHLRKVLIVAVIALVAAAGSGCSRGDKIIKVADLPQTEDFEIFTRPGYAPDVAPKKVHVDIGYIWKQNKLLFMPILNDNGHYVGYTGSETQYIELKQGELEEWTRKANISLPPNPSIPFWEAWGGKLLLIVLIPPFAILSLLLDRLWRRITTGM